MPPPTPTLLPTHPPPRSDERPSSEHTHSIGCAAVLEVRSLASPPPRGAKAGRGLPLDPKGFLLATEYESDGVLRVDSDKDVDRWVAAISASAKWVRENAGKGGSGSGGGKRGRARSDGSDDDDSDDGRGGSGRKGRRDSDADSDEDDEDGGFASRLPPPPKWWRAYEKADEVVWMTATQAVLDGLFAGIYTSSGAGGEDAAATGDGERRVDIGKLSQVTARACSELEDRAMECRMRGRGDVVKHHITMFDLKFLQELTPLTTGVGPSLLSPKQLLQVIDCIEGFIATRKRALGGMQLAPHEKRPGNVLRETRRDMITKYVEVMGPKLASVKDQVLSRLSSQRSELVRKTRGNQVGTNTPTDFFSLMSEHMRLAKDAGSYALQRRLLSQVMALVVSGATWNRDCRDSKLSALYAVSAGRAFPHPSKQSDLSPIPPSLLRFLSLYTAPSPPCRLSTPSPCCWT